MGNQGLGNDYGNLGLNQGGIGQYLFTNAGYYGNPGPTPSGMYRPNFPAPGIYSGQWAMPSLSGPTFGAGWGYPPTTAPYVGPNGIEAITGNLGQPIGWPIGSDYWSTAISQASGPYAGAQTLTSGR